MVAWITNVQSVYNKSQGKVILKYASTRFKCSCDDSCDGKFFFFDFFIIHIMPSFFEFKLNQWTK